MTVTIKDNTLVVAIPLTEKVSSTGKNIIIATSGGNKATSVRYKDKEVIIGLNAYIKND